MKRLLLLLLASLLLLPMYTVSSPAVSASSSSTFADRKADMLDVCVDVYEPQFNATTNLVFNASVGKHLSRDGAWMAYCYLEKGIEMARANDLIRAVIDLQETSGPNRGNFYWYYEDTAVNDRNAVAFIIPTLGYIYHHHYSMLEPDVQTALGSTLQEAELCILGLRENVPVWYGNIFLALIDALVTVGNEQTALAWAQEYKQFTESFGINEYGSRNYDIVQLASLQNAYSHAQDPTLKAILLELVEFHWYTVAHQMHPVSTMFSTTGSRPLNGGFVPNPSVLTAFYLYFDEGPLENFDFKPRTELLLSDYQPNAAVRSIYQQKKTQPMEWQAQFGRVDSHVYQTPHYSLATQSGRRSSLGIMNTTKTVLSNENQENSIQMLVNNGNERSGIAFRATDIPVHLDDFNHHWVTSVQKENKAVVSYNFDPRNRTVQSLRVKAELGHQDELAPGQDFSGILINGSPWNGTHTSLATTDTLAYQLGQTYIGLRFLASDVIAINGHNNIDASRPILLKQDTSFNGDPVISLTSYLNYSATNVLLTDKNKRMGFVLEMADANDFSSLTVFNSHMQNIQITQSVNQAVHQVTVQTGNDSLYLQENLERNTILSRKVNGVDYNNGYLLKSKFVSYESEGSLTNAQIDANGELTYPAPQPPASAPHYLLLEAEDLAVAAPMEVRNRAGASNGQTIFTPTAYAGTAGYGVNIPHTGEWKVWIRVYYPDGGSNSMDVRMNTDNVGYPYLKTESHTYNQFHWIEVNTYQLHRGIHTLMLKGRESDSEVDQILVTNDLSHVPN
ncbi:hypothetical protein [Paenibacillus sp. 1P07SE]|uniref:hypothetical protein n=1 Tax=Paenibacillus sp. 1P07SE TaxID=3132209 RepID=UPI0039A45ABB